MTASATYPVSFDEFYSTYIEKLADEDKPSTYVAYCRTEAQFSTDQYPRRYANHNTFKVMVSKTRKRARK